MRTALATLAAAACLCTGAAAAPSATDAHLVSLTLKDHRFAPASVTVPAGRQIRVELSNQDAASEEFDSIDLQVEEDVTPHGKTSFVVGPLKPGRYSFMGELHADTASGELVAVEAP